MADAYRSFLILFDNFDRGHQALAAALRLTPDCGSRMTFAAVVPAPGTTANSWFSAAYFPQNILHAQAVAEAERWIAALSYEVPGHVSLTHAVHVGKVSDIAVTLLGQSTHDAICLCERSVGRGLWGVRRGLRKLTGTGVPVICVSSESSGRERAARNEFGADSAQGKTSGPDLVVIAG